MRPLIGVTSGVSEDGLINLNVNYCLAIRQAGGTPLVLPSLPAEKESTGERVGDAEGKLAGLLFSGGGDVDPVYFGEEPLVGTGQISPDRDLFELNLARRALELNLPVLAICRGMQVLNIAAGGDIWQDIGLGFSWPLKHFQQAPRGHATHSITVAKGSLLYDGLGLAQVRVNSFHHQVLRKIAPGFRVSARSADGVAEGIESTGHSFILGVQFHPEYLWQQNREFASLFRSFVCACRA